MTIPVWVLLGFAGWTLLTLMVGVGIYRWIRILTRAEEIKSFRADDVRGSDFYKRAMRAHANCVENLPVYGAIVLASVAAGVDSPVLDVLALVLIGARILQTSVHLGLVQTNLVVAVRFTFFFVQLLCMAAMGGYVAVTVL